MKNYLRKKTKNKVGHHLELLDAAMATKYGARYMETFVLAREDLCNGRYGTAVVEKGVRMAKMLVRSVEEQAFGKKSKNKYEPNYIASLYGE